MDRNLFPDHLAKQLDGCLLGLVDLLVALCGDLYRPRFQRTNPTGIYPRGTAGAHPFVSHTIYNYALRQKKDLILISTKGKGALTSFVIGSVANRLIQHDLHVPLLVVKVGCGDLSKPKPNLPFVASRHR